MKEKTVERCVFWVLVFAVYFVLVQTNGCSDDTTILKTAHGHQGHHDHPGKGHHKGCNYEFWVEGDDCFLTASKYEIVIDSLEAALEECQDD